jgi:uncharacterized membrane-anchored protein YjiN (DUF445 family)
MTAARDRDAEPMSDSDVDAREAALQARLSRMRRIATGLLLAMAALFAVTHSLLETYPGLGIVNAFAEAGTIGALADWFAVTALFRRPLGLPIPHTAIVSSRKDEIGRALAGFIREHFLTREAAQRRLADVNLAERLGDWLAADDNARRVSRDGGLALSFIVRAADSGPLRHMLDTSLQNSLDGLPLRAALSVVIEVLSSGGHAEAVLDHLVAIGQQQLDENRDRIRERIRERSPWWLPRFVDEAIYDQLVAELDRILADIGTSPTHPAREEFKRRLHELAETLSDDSRVADRTRQLKTEFLRHPAVREYLADLWARLREQVCAALEDADSPLRAAVEQELRAVAERIRTDAGVRDGLDRWLKDLIVYLVENYRRPLSETISDTIEQWDPSATARRIELYIGSDLQFIRISGTLVGGTAGVLLYLAASLLPV